MNIEIRKPNLDEWEAYKTLRLESLKECPTAFASSYEESKDESEEKWKMYIERSLNSQGSVMLSAYDEAKMIGMIVATWEDRMKTKHIAHINGVYVLPEYRGQGVAKKLFEEVLSELKSMNRFRKLSLNVTSRNKIALGFYEKLGFKKSGVLTEELLVDGEYHDTTSMEMFLDSIPS